MHNKDQSFKENCYFVFYFLPMLRALRQLKIFYKYSLVEKHQNVVQRAAQGTWGQESKTWVTITVTALQCLVLFSSAKCGGTG
jgi:hypothetical protein